MKYEVEHDARVKDPWHLEESGARASSLSTCGPGTGDEPVCNGDSGGPAFNSRGEVVAVTSLGDPTCLSYGQSVRVDAYQNWIDTTMTGWGDPINGATGGGDGGGATVDAAISSETGGAPAIDSGGTAQEGGMADVENDAPAEAQGGAQTGQGDAMTSVPTEGGGITPAAGSGASSGTNESSAVGAPTSGGCSVSAPGGGRASAVAVACACIAALGRKRRTRRAGRTRVQTSRHSEDVLRP
jgi:hypothetical protein